MLNPFINRISYRDRVPNEEVRKKIKQAVGPYEELIRIVKKIKFKWFGNFKRSNGSAIVVMQGKVPGGGITIEWNHLIVKE